MAKPKTHDLATEARILEAARQVFRQKGYVGARMEEIAEKAHINKSMLHYYFRSKERLFEVVFQADAGQMAPYIIGLLTADRPLLEKIPAFVEAYLTVILEHPYIPGFIINELARNEGELLQKVRAQAPGIDFLGTFFAQIDEEIHLGRIQPVDPRHLLLTMLSACVFPFLARPLIKMALHLDEAGFQAFVEERKTHVTQFILSGLTVPTA
jgi:AcrR family transcriptional regulator